MDLLREIVGGPKHRYKQNGYNLDLTYITERIIAMAFPASGFQKMYRNSIDSVSEFLLKQHQNKYITVNLSGRDIESDKLKNVSCFQWQDHRSPLIETLFIICQSVCSFLAQDDERIAVFHCNHGKGRTGTIICCFFLYMNIFNSPQECLKYYAEKRFEDKDTGVKQPCQINYIHYFHKVLTMKNQVYPRLLQIRQITLKGEHEAQSPYYKLKKVQNGNVILSTKNHAKVLKISKPGECTTRFAEHIGFAGDVLLEIKNQVTLKPKNTLMAMYMFNTCFINPQECLVVKLSQLSPRTTYKSGKFGLDFTLEIQFKQLCQCIQQNERCVLCKDVLFYEGQRWKKIDKALKLRARCLIRNKIIVFGIKK